MAAVLECPDVDLRLVMSNRADAAGLAKARRAGVSTLPMPMMAAQSVNKSSASKIDWDAVAQILVQQRIEAIFLLGFMRIVPSSFVERFKGRIVNLHPSLLPAYPGLNSIAAAHAAGDASGATVHVVVPEVDAGPIVRQRTTANAPSGFCQSLAATEFSVHLDEQKLVKEAAVRWRPATA